MAENIEEFIIDGEGRLIEEPWYKKVGAGIKKAAKATGEFISEHKTEIFWSMVIGGSTAVGVANANAKAKKQKRLAMERLLNEYNSELRVWDNRNGFYVTLNRQLTGAEKEFIDQERRNGRSLTDICSSMGILYTENPVVDDETLKAWRVKK